MTKFAELVKLLSRFKVLKRFVQPAQIFGKIFVQNFFVQIAQKFFQTIDILKKRSSVSVWPTPSTLRSNYAF